ncbi:uncharacterized protein LOC134281918 [Saccostrea cucullata]|uniref:uncharacterized protein LOC134281918 n=1 Tax=Saccostrea cuccullata TaxID=36930 RepID=UPI002ED3C720
MDESCPPNHKMFPIHVKVGALAKATGCPNYIVKGTNSTLESMCCNHTDSACLNFYRNTLNDSITYVYHKNCMGREMCISHSIVQATTTGPVVFCNQTLYHSTTTVLELKYQCYKDEQFLTLSSSESVSKTGLTDVHVVLQDYESSPGIPAAVTSLECSIETSECDGQIRITAKDLRLFSNGSHCLQRISINDTENAEINNFDCSHNTDFTQNTNFYTSLSNHIIVKFTNSYNFDGGFLWIQPTAVNSSDTLSLNCPPTEENPACIPTTVIVTTEEDTTTTVVTETTTGTTPATNNTDLDPEDNKPQEETEDVGLIVGLSVGLVALVVAVVALVVIKKRKPCSNAPERKVSQARPDKSTVEINNESSSSPQNDYVSKTQSWSHLHSSQRVFEINEKSTSLQNDQSLAKPPRSHLAPISAEDEYKVKKKKRKKKNEKKCESDNKKKKKKKKKKKRHTDGSGETSNNPTENDITSPVNSAM